MATRTQKSKELIQEWLSALEDPARPLSVWETNFIESISNQFDHRGDLSDKQFEILERIYAEKTA